MNLEQKFSCKPARVIMFSLLGSLLIIVAAFLLYLSVADFNPPENEIIHMEKPSTANTIPVGKIELYTWDIAYGGKGKDMFEVEQKPVQPAKELSGYERNRDGIIYQLTTLNKLDFVLLQQVDLNSKRSFFDNQVERFKATFKDYVASFTITHKTRAIPFLCKTGTIQSGLLTLSKFKPYEVKRIAYQSTYAWPMRLMKPDFGFLLTRYKVSNGKQMVILNFQNPDFAESAIQFEKWIAQLKAILMDEYSKGNYVIAGGNWNVNPFDLANLAIEDGNKISNVANHFPSNFLPDGFLLAFDAKHPSVRSVDMPYKKGETATSIVDFFLLSPNFKLVTVNVLDSNFEFSNHQAVGMIVEMQ